VLVLTDRDPGPVAGGPAHAGVAPVIMMTSAVAPEI
jgi:hypothetical protein